MQYLPSTAASSSSSLKSEEERNGFFDWGGGSGDRKRTRKSLSKMGKQGIKYDGGRVEKKLGDNFGEDDVNGDDQGIA